MPIRHLTGNKGVRLDDWFESLTYNISGEPGKQLRGQTIVAGIDVNFYEGSLENLLQKLGEGYAQFYFFVDAAVKVVFLRSFATHGIEVRATHALSINNER